MNTAINFNGTIPHYYEDYLTKFLFEGFAEDIVKRVSFSSTTKVLELASGTGCVTRLLVNNSPATTQITATDLAPDMLEVARKNIAASNISWAMVDMTDITYEDNSFDVIVCQFGVMLVPDKLTALHEMYRVLKPGGQLVFNVWGSIHDNAVWNIGGQVVDSFLKNNPIIQDPGPFSLNEKNTIPLLKEAGFSSITTTVVNQTGNIKTAAMAAEGFIQGLPVVLAISKNNPALIPQIQQVLEQKLIQELGNYPLQSSLQALVFEAYK